MQIEVDLVIWIQEKKKTFREIVIEFLLLD